MKRTNTRLPYVVSLLVPVEIEVLASNDVWAGWFARRARLVVAASAAVQGFAVGVPEVTAVRPTEKQVKK